MGFFRKILDFFANLFGKKDKPSVQEHETPVQKPETPTQKPETPVQKPKTPTQKPVERCIIVKMPDESVQRSQIETLKAFLRDNTIPEENKNEIKHQIDNINKGKAGEDAVRNYLKNQAFPMCVLSDLFLPYQIDDQTKTAQIDCIVITPRKIFILEIKNYKTPVRIDKDGNFFVKDSNNVENLVKKNPVTQNQYHLEAILSHYPELKEYFYPLVVLADSGQPLDMRQAPADVQGKITQLGNSLMMKIKTVNQNSRCREMSQADRLRIAKKFLSKHMPQTKDYVSKYKSELFGRCPVCKNALFAAEFRENAYCDCHMNIGRIYKEKMSLYEMRNLFRKGQIIVRTSSNTGEKFFRTVYKEVNDSDPRWPQWKTGPVSCPNCHHVDTIKYLEKGWECTYCHMHLCNYRQLSDAVVTALLNGTPAEYLTKNNYHRVAYPTIKEVKNFGLQWTTFSMSEVKNQKISYLSIDELNSFSEQHS